MQRAWLTPKRSLAGRLALAVTGAVTAALILAAALSVWREVTRYADDKHRALEAVAQVFAHGGARATADDDADAAAASLRAIGNVPSIVYGAIERADGSILAEQGLGLRLTQDAAQDGEDLSLLRMLATRTLRVTAPIEENGGAVGRVVLIGETDDILDHIRAAGLNAALAALLAVAIGIGVSLYLQRSVTRPLSALARTMDAVRLRHDYAQRAPVASDDEVGALARTFNDLLSAVNERDHRLAAHSAHLEAEVRARTADLSEAKQAAETANAAKSTFLATMSHEIRTPMNGVLVMAELLASSDLPVRQRRYAEVIARSGTALLAIINDILDFAKVEAGKLDLERVPVSPAEVADTVIMLFAERARAAGLDLAAEIAPDVPRAILGDPVRLGQVVSNFVSNALKFTEAGHVSVRMTIDARDGCLVIAVTDTGIGIPQDKLATIFSAFSQADQSTTRRFGGTGLGLSIAQRIIAAMGGTVAVASRAGVGSTFSARIPMEIEAAAQPVARHPSVPARVVLRAAGPATREALAAGLRAAGFEPVEATGAGPRPLDPRRRRRRGGGPPAGRRGPRPRRRRAGRHRRRRGAPDGARRRDPALARHPGGVAARPRGSGRGRRLRPLRRAGDPGGVAPPLPGRAGAGRRRQRGQPRGRRRGPRTLRRHRRGGRRGRRRRGGRRRRAAFRPDPDGRQHAGPGRFRGRPDHPRARSGVGRPAHPDHRPHRPCPRRGRRGRGGLRHGRLARQALHPDATRRDPAGARAGPSGCGPRRHPRRRRPAGRGPDLRLTATCSTPRSWTASSASGTARSWAASSTCTVSRPPRCWRF